MTDRATLAVLDALEAEGGADCARFVGGCVRNTLMGLEASDIDIATVLTPERVTRAIEAAGLRAVPTGVDHGTVTAIADHRPFEITTLRRDVSTDGRNATVAFSTDWAEDAQRRDFRLNALYADRAGQVFDHVGGGIDDAEFGRIVFVGDPETRIREDYLRILRFFRFFAWYGQPGQADAAGLDACAAMKGGMDRLSAERISKELLRLLEAADPREAVRLMDQAGVLEVVLPGPLERDRFEAMVGIDADPILRLSALLPDDPETVREHARRLRLSNAQRDRLCGAAMASVPVSLDMDLRAARAAIYRLEPGAFEDRVRRLWAASPAHAEPARQLLMLAGSWKRPTFPIGGAEALAAGATGPDVGRLLRAVEDWWVAEDFPAGGALAKLHQLAAGEAGA